MNAPLPADDQMTEARNLLNRAYSILSIREVSMRTAKGQALLGQIGRFLSEPVRETPPARRIPTNADVDYVLQVYKPEIGDGHRHVYVDSPTVPGLHCGSDTAEKALACAPAQVEQLRKDNVHE